MNNIAVIMIILFLPVGALAESSIYTTKTGKQDASDCVTVRGSTTDEFSANEQLDVAQQGGDIAPDATDVAIDLRVFPERTGNRTLQRSAADSAVYVGAYEQREGDASLSVLGDEVEMTAGSDCR